MYWKNVKLERPYASDPVLNKYNTYRIKIVYNNVQKTKKIYIIITDAHISTKLKK